MIDSAHFRINLEKLHTKVIGNCSALVITRTSKLRLVCCFFVCFFCSFLLVFVYVVVFILFYFFLFLQIMKERQRKMCQGPSAKFIKDLALQL